MAAKKKTKKTTSVSKRTVAKKSPAKKPPVKKPATTKRSEKQSAPHKAVVQVDATRQAASDEGSVARELSQLARRASLARLMRG
jgi:hypothetical protein